MSTRAFANRYSHKITWHQIDQNSIRRLIEKARSEDLSGFGLKIPPEHTGDVTSQLVQPHISGKAQLVAREDMILCGISLIPLILEAYHARLSFESGFCDGHFLKKDSVIGEFSGNAANLLQAERIILNFLQKLSGISTITKRFVDQMGETETRLLDTRKTTPGLRVLEKYATACGGGWNHRFGLFDRILIKDNHLAAANALGGEKLTDFIKFARRKFPDLTVEVEVDQLEQIGPAIDGGAHIILLDNFSIDKTVEALKLTNHQIATEASGSINLETIKQRANMGLDFISTGATIHKATWVDIGLDWQ